MIIDSVAWAQYMNVRDIQTRHHRKCRANALRREAENNLSGYSEPQFLLEKKALGKACVYLASIFVVQVLMYWRKLPSRFTDELVIPMCYSKGRQFTNDEYSDSMALLNRLSIKTQVTQTLPVSWHLSHNTATPFHRFIHRPTPCPYVTMTLIVQQSHNHPLKIPWGALQRGPYVR